MLTSINRNESPNFFWSSQIKILEVKYREMISQKTITMSSKTKEPFTIRMAPYSNVRCHTAL